MAKKTVPFQLIPEMDVAHTIAPRKDIRKVLDVHGGEIMRQKTIEISQLLWHDQDSTKKDVNIRIARALELFESLEPADGAEGMIATQMVGTHFAALECLRRATLPNQTFEGRDMALKHAEKLMALYAKQLATLDKHHGKGQQKVTVEHVHVEAGGQAIVGNVETGQRGKKPLRSVSGIESDAIEHVPDPQIPEVQTKNAVARKKP
ncbi:hypothetical protein [Sulfitobacter geojensis]|uniref:hypothetical protein n=1 Tax=Sulfitobacter geojensis TaxID=1342299 RepID=UPI000468C26B|nr:hypothetical protein [Sulfitobacter geojensis]NYI27472.1 hypothetical protein [Sulfitobacter geojensis]